MSRIRIQEKHEGNRRKWGIAVAKGNQRSWSSRKYMMIWTQAVAVHEIAGLYAEVKDKGDWKSRMDVWIANKHMKRYSISCHQGNAN